MKEKYKVSEKVLDKYIQSYSKIFGGEITEEEIKERLASSGFNGIYIIPKSEYRKTDGDDHSDGKYLSASRMIITYPQEKLESVIMHELTHALLQSCFLVSKNVEDLGTELRVKEAGYGIEEGVAGLVGTISDNKNNLYNIKKFDSYSPISHTVQMLNLLYEDYRDKKYSSILVEFIKNPDKSLFLIRDLFDDIIENKFSKYENNYGYSSRELKNLSYKMAYDILKGTDYLRDIYAKYKNADFDTGQQIYSYINLLIGNLYALSHVNINMGRKFHTEIEKNVFGEDLIESLRVVTINTIYYVINHDTQALKEEAEKEYLERLFEISGFMTMFIDYEEFPTQLPRM